MDGVRLSGIWQPIRLVCTDDAYIESLQIEPQSPEWANFAVRINNTTNIRADAEIFLTVYDPKNPKRKLVETQQIVVVSPGLNLAGLLIKVPKAIQWGTYHPMLYPYRLEFRQGRNLLDNEEGTFGFRSVVDRGGRLLLNGARYPMKTYRLDWLEAPRDSSLQDFAKSSFQKARSNEAGGFIVEAGAPDVVYDEADHNGIPLIVKLPKDLAAAKAVVLQAFNHPGIIGWLFPASSDAYSDSISELEALDPTRPVLQRLPEGGRSPD